MSEKSINAELSVGETVVIGAARVTLLEKSGKRARFRITADTSVRVDLPRRASSGAEQALKGIKT